ncbi:Uncharacterized protein Rs2_44284 [Raphanus sativus]|uniref:Uncharacterized protein At4g04775-like n=1 Tax=Raphanus sativus TaxID=3726 RepID=A0A9W3CJJ2_RAPSA|nr:uncharacterized protein At4g04775-like [Raphanus sativus]KAJ4873953.1 Uncharacterized protein Rs2_44284 [Raphanus sativus]
MSTSSSMSSRSAARRTVHGVPIKCWCGKGLVVWASETKENPFRRFYRCEVALQRKTESHLFKWEDEAILDEVRMLDAKIMDLVHDIQTLSKTVSEQIDLHKAECVFKVDEHIKQMKQEIRQATRQMKEEVEAIVSSNTVVKPLADSGTTHNFLAAVAIVGAITCLYWKFL